MTANQISFAKLNEERRHNLVSESETQRHNVADEGIRQEANQIAAYNTQITNEHYIRQDAINAEHYGRMDEETARNHIAMETETERSNRAKESIEREKLRETKRANRKSEEIEARKAEAAVLNAQASVTQASAAETQAKVAATNAETNAKNAESNAKQAEAALLNASANVKNAETNRLSYVTDASYKQASIIIDQNKLDETIRHNKESEYNEDRRNSINFITTPSANTKVMYEGKKVNAEVYKSEAQATEALARAGYLRTQDDWYAWRTATSSAVDISTAVKNFMATPVNIVTGGK